MVKGKTEEKITQGRAMSSFFFNPLGRVLPLVYDEPRRLAARQQAALAVAGGLGVVQGLRDGVAREQVIQRGEELAGGVGHGHSADAPARPRMSNAPGEIHAR